ncbi:hypothetical protein [Paenibacillus sonchi]|uniref:hypothetical protein n=1 Tax=Paenibacillus sonchi TaxID=373687 RepID=UPI001E48538A|nr:hypothetical protein [Paenibacillus sonchi]MCE3204110.1 hypothetical protein [Paenibacillus sonchi]
MDREDDLVEEWIVNDCMEYDKAFLEGRISAPCMICAHCLDFGYYKKELYQYLQGDNTKEDLIKSMQYWKKAISWDKLYKHMSTGTHPSEFKREPFTYNDNYIVIYLDKNVYNHYFLKGKHFESELLKSKGNQNIYYVYSPAHLEEM